MRITLRVNKKFECDIEVSERVRLNEVIETLLQKGLIYIKGEYYAKAMICKRVVDIESDFKKMGIQDNEIIEVYEYYES